MLLLDKKMWKKTKLPTINMKKKDISDASKFRIFTIIQSDMSFPL